MYSLPWMLTNLLDSYETVNTIIQIISLIVSPFYTLDRGIKFYFFNFLFKKYYLKYIYLFILFLNE